MDVREIRGLRQGHFAYLFANVCASCSLLTFHPY